MRLLVPDAMPLSLLPGSEGGQPEVSLRLMLDLDEALSADEGDAWWSLRRYDPEPECFCHLD